MTRRWTEAEWDTLFGQYPLARRFRPAGAGLARLAWLFGRTPGAVAAMWDDADAYRRRLKSTAASRHLKAYLEGRRMLASQDRRPFQRAPTEH